MVRVRTSALYYGRTDETSSCWCRRTCATRGLAGERDASAKCSVRHINLEEGARVGRCKIDIVAHVLDSYDAPAIGRAAGSERARSFRLMSRHSDRSWFH